MADARTLDSRLSPAATDGVLALLHAVRPDVAWRLAPHPGADALAVLVTDAVSAADAADGSAVWRFGRDSDWDSDWRLPDPALFAPVPEAPTRQLITVGVMQDDAATALEPARLPAQVETVRLESTHSAQREQALQRCDLVICTHWHSAIAINARLKPAIRLHASGETDPLLPYVLPAAGPGEVCQLIARIEPTRLAPALLNWKRRCRQRAEARIAAWLETLSC